MFCGCVGDVGMMSVDARPNGRFGSVAVPVDGGGVGVGVADDAAAEDDDDDEVDAELVANMRTANELIGHPFAMSVSSFKFGCEDIMRPERRELVRLSSARYNMPFKLSFKM